MPVLATVKFLVRSRDEREDLDSSLGMVARPKFRLVRHMPPVRQGNRAQVAVLRPGAGTGQVADRRSILMSVRGC